ncbi:hypothetical protein Smar_1549 [Staphylothermus marinus F1]|uniref:Polymerase beta nucleotidyltransferase domain-containing protein n=1 Tax=Staphylothermus marinus (strain ATCC 43588 / DSM 3639 / JCM 9404 / F1) TaxID=399550 RepID=A3DPS5_STAMF|nr:nucleotidyltransferase domain-containing protein [Staphylothermus marinus]ABN70635.1 hypothetical protein Smar_1549 [Staphylothermus marinus F1]
MDKGIYDCFRSIASKYGLRYLVVYGSHAGGYAGPHSDYDVAVKAGRNLSLVERGLILSMLEKCAGRRVDLLVIDDWNPIAVWEALSNGDLIYYCGRECLNEYYEDLAKAIDEVADLEPLIKLFRREMHYALTRSGGKNF